MQTNRLRKALLSVSVLALLSACGQVKADKSPITDSSAYSGALQSSASAANTPTAPAGETKHLNIKAYYADSNAEKLIEQETLISYKQDDDKYMAVLKALASSSDNTRIPLFKSFMFKSAVFANGLLTIDVKMPPEARLGSSGEALLLKALKKTIFQFSEIQSIELLVDGQAVESLMGHMDLPHPFKR